MNELMIFDNSEFGKIRTLTENGKTLFCATDVAKSLGYTNPHKAISDHCPSLTKREVGVQTGIKSDGTPAFQIHAINFIPEGDVYRLIAHSKLPAAIKFEQWVFDEVIPSVRKHGAYLTPETLEQAILNPDTMIKLCTTLKHEQEKRKALEAKIETDAPLVSFAQDIGTANGSISIGDFAKVLYEKGHREIGQKRLFQRLRDAKILDKRNMPYQKYMDAGLFEVIEIYNRHNGQTYRQPRLTGKGQRKIYEQLFCAQ